MVETRFKQSSYGLIPQDWMECRFEDVLQTFSTGATPYRGIPSNFQGAIRWISSGELNYNRIYDTIEHISEEALQNTHLRLHPAGTFLMAITGLEAAGTRGRCAFVGAPSATNQSCLAINSTDKMTVEYLYWFYLYWSDTLAFKYSQGTKQQSFTADIVRNLPIYLPPTMDEQKRIAEALCDVDALISELDRLIAKKHLIKQGAMQQLLKPKENWETLSLGDALSYEQPQPYLVSSEDYCENGGTPVLTAGKTFILGYTTETGGIYTNLPVIIFDDFTTDSRLVDFPFKAKSSAMKMLKPKREDVDIRYVYEQMQQIGFEPGDHQRHWISIFSKFLIPIPSFPEQQHIAAILTDMDNEISELEQKKAKYEAVKQGMMQQLLTGRIRLIP